MSENNGTAVVEMPVVERIPANAEVEVKDKYGRVAFDRTVELEIDDAQWVDEECEAGNHQTFDQALHYMLERGRAEIKRARESLIKTKVQRHDAKMHKALEVALGNDPDIIDDAKAMRALLAQLGIKPKK